jgi:hypothetical protein
MEMVLDVYKRPYDPLNPVFCMDESPKQLIEKTRIPIPCSPGLIFWKKSHFNVKTQTKLRW